MPQLSLLRSCTTCSCTCSRFITGRLINLWNTNRTVNVDKQGKPMQLFYVYTHHYLYTYFIIMNHVSAF